MPVKVWFVGGSGLEVGTLVAGLSVLGIGATPPNEISGVFLDAEPCDSGLASILKASIGVDSKQLIAVDSNKQLVKGFAHFLERVALMPREMQALLFSQEELNCNVSDGFHGMPKLGAACYDLHFKNNPLLQPIANERDTLYVVFSAFGGTGAGLGPRIVKHAIANAPSNSTICVIAFAPYFRNIPPRDEANTLVALNEVKRHFDGAVRDRHARLGLGMVVLDCSPDEELSAPPLPPENGKPREPHRAKGLLAAARLIADDIPGKILRQGLILAGAEEQQTVQKMWASAVSPDFSVTLRNSGSKKQAFCRFGDLARYVDNSKRILGILRTLITDDSSVSGCMAKDGKPLRVYGNPLLASLALWKKDGEDLKERLDAVKPLLDRLGLYFGKPSGARSPSWAWSLPQPGGQAGGYLRGLEVLFRNSYFSTNRPATADVDRNRRVPSPTYLAPVNRADVDASGASVILVEAVIQRQKELVPAPGDWFTSLPDMWAVPRQFNRLRSGPEGDARARAAKGELDLLEKKVYHGISMEERRWPAAGSAGPSVDGPTWALLECGTVLCGYRTEFGLWVPFESTADGGLRFLFGGPTRMVPATAPSSPDQVRADDPSHVPLCGGKLMWQRDTERTARFLHDQLEDGTNYGIQIVRPVGHTRWDLVWTRDGEQPSALHSPHFKLDGRVADRGDRGLVTLWPHFQSSTNVQTFEVTVAAVVDSIQKCDRPSTFQYVRFEFEQDR